MTTVSDHAPRVLSFHELSRDTTESAQADWLPNLAFTAALYAEVPAPSELS